MTSDVIYGRNTFTPYFNVKRFEDTIYNRASEREKRIKYKKRLKIVDKIIVLLNALLFAALIASLSCIAIETYRVMKTNDDIVKLEATLDKKKYDNDNSTRKLKTEMKFDDLKMKAYMELNMITPTEKNIIYFDKSDNGFVRQYENIR